MIRPRRTMLYAPATNARAVEKARTLSADCVALDLEDAVAPDAKAAARAAALAAIAAGDWGRRELIVRVNGLETPEAEADFAALAGSAADAILLPKLRSAQDAARGVALAAGKPLWVMIETPQAVLHAEQIAATPGVAALVAGFNDLALELRARPAPGRQPMHYAMAQIVLAARAAGIFALDGVYDRIDDPEGLAAEAQQAADFGFDGKSVIHPAQIAPVNAAFTPGPEEVEHARGVIAAHRDAAAQGRHVATFRGRMVEVLHVLQAEHTLKIAELAGEMGGLAEKVIEVATE